MVKWIYYEYTFEVAGYQFGFVDRETGPGAPYFPPVTVAELGPLGSHNAPLSAPACWAIVLFGPPLLAIIAAAFVKRSRVKRRKALS